MEYYYKIENTFIKVICKKNYLVEKMLPYTRFRIDSTKEDYLVNLFIVNSLPKCNGKLIYQDNYNSVYQNNLLYRYIGRDYLIIENNFRKIDVYLKSSLLVINEKQLFNAIGLDSLLAKKMKLLLHSSFITYKDQGLLFTAPSGTGKSTQADLWKQYIDGVEIINGDRSIIGIENNRVKAYGLPFCGTSMISLSQECYLKAIVVLRQGKVNYLKKIAGKEAYKYLYSQINWIGWDTSLQINILKILDIIIEKTPIYYFECLPNYLAVNLLKKEIFKED